MIGSKRSPTQRSEWLGRLRTPRHRSAISGAKALISTRKLETIGSMNGAESGTLEMPRTVSLTLGTV